MKTKRILGRLALSAGVALAMAIPLMVTAQGNAATGSLTVDLGSARGPATGVGSGFLYGMSQDGTQPSDALLEPLKINAFRGGGHVGNWIADGYRYGSGTQASVNSVIAQARRLTAAPHNIRQYQAILSDLYGADAGQPASTIWPCDNGDCSNYVAFLNAVVPVLQNSGIKFSYDIWNEPDLSIFWARGMNTTQYFQMWDTAFKELRRLAPSAILVGPSTAATPQRASSMWQTWLSHVKSAGTVPDQITTHLLVGGDDPVTVAQITNNNLTANGIPLRPLVTNEYQPQDQLSAGVSAWFLARLAQSTYTYGMRANWDCCVKPNLTGLLTPSGSSWVTSGNYWVYRSYADVTGTLLTTSAQVGSTAIAAAQDDTVKRAVAIIGDSSTNTGSGSVTFRGLSSVPWLTGLDNVKVVVNRIPDQASLAQPQTVLSQTMSIAGGSITVPFTTQASHDAFAIYLTPGSGTATTSPSASASPTPTTTPSSTGGAGCTATYQVSGSWSGGFQGGVTITNTGSQRTNGWNVSWTFPDGQVITQAWNGAASQSGAAVSVTNVSWNGALDPGGTADFGFIANWNGANRTPSNVTCSAS